MGKKAIEIEGTVSEVLPDATFRVELENGRMTAAPLPPAVNSGSISRSVITRSRAASTRSRSMYLLVQSVSVRSLKERQP